MSDDFPIPTREEVWREILRRQATTNSTQLLILQAIDGVEQRIMALSTQEQAAFDGLNAQLTQIGTDVDAAFAAATTQNQALRDQIAGLETLRDQLVAANALDEQQLADLNAQIAALQGAQAANEADVVGALGALSGALGGLDQHIQGLGTPTP